MSQRIAAIILIVILWAGGCAAGDTVDRFPDMASSYLVLIDGKPVWEHDATKPLAPASLTKVMTVYLALKKLKIDEIITVSRAAETGTRIGLRGGERLYMAHLLAATLMSSANDACLALAYHIGGDEARFVKIMNSEARALGMRRTHFMKPKRAKNITP